LTRPIIRLIVRASKLTTLSYPGEDLALSHVGSMKGFWFNVFLAIVRILVVVGAMVFMSEFSRAAEHDWRAYFLNQQGTPCCDEIDCREIQQDVALQLRLGELARVGEFIQTPVNAIHPTQDGRSWVCTTGCLFRPALN